MNNFFENHLEEIKIITARSKKESRKSYSRLQKASEYILKLRNGIVMEHEIKILEGINVHQVTDNGEVLLASSDRIYLPDVATRLYQGLDNILKSYKSHRVHDGHKFPDGAEDNQSQIDYIDLAEWETEYNLSVLKEAFSNISQQAKDKFDIEFVFDGHYSIWNIFNPESKTTEFDEFYIVLNYKIYEKETGKVLVDRYKKLSNSDIRNKRIDLSKIINSINELGELYIKSESKKVELKPETIFFNDFLTGHILINKLQNLEGKKVIEFHTNDLVNEKNDRHGNICKSMDENCLENLKTRQRKFSSMVKYAPRNIALNSISEEVCDSWLCSEFVDVLKSKFKGKKFLMVFSKESTSSEEFSDHLVINPTIAFYFDGKEISLADINAVEILDQNDLEFNEEITKELYKYDGKDLYIGVATPKYSFTNSKNTILI